MPLKYLKCTDGRTIKVNRIKKTRWRIHINSRNILFARFLAQWYVMISKHFYHSAWSSIHFHVISSLYTVCGLQTHHGWKRRQRHPPHILYFKVFVIIELYSCAVKFTLNIQFSFVEILVINTEPYYPGMMHMFFASLAWRSYHIHSLHHCYLNNKCICIHLCTHGRANLKVRCVQAHCWSVAILKHLK